MTDLDTLRAAEAEARVYIFNAAVFANASVGTTAEAINRKQRYLDVYNDAVDAYATAIEARVLGEAEVARVLKTRREVDAWSQGKRGGY